MSPERSDEGAIAIVVAALAIVLFGFGALVVDLGMARDLRQRSADSADAAALAGSADLRLCTNRACVAAVAAVKASADRNVRRSTEPALDWRRCRATPPAGWTWRQRRSRSQCIQFGWTGPASGKPSAIFVAIPPRTSPSAFGAVFDFEGLTVSGAAVAGSENPPVAPCALCILDAMAAPGGSVNVLGGGSLHATNAAASGGFVRVVGGGIYLTNSGTGSGFAPPPVVTDQPVTDPFGSVGTPVPPPGRSRIDECGAGTNVLAPGTYTRDLTVVGTCTLAPGVYEFTRDLVIGAGARLQGLAGVTLVFRNNDTLVVQGGTVDLGPPAFGETISLFLRGPDSNPVTVETGVLRTGGPVYGERRELNVVSGTVNINGTAVLDGLDIRSGTVTIVSPGSGSAQSGPQELGLVQ